MGNDPGLELMMVSCNGPFEGRSLTVERGLLQDSIHVISVVWIAVIQPTPLKVHGTGDQADNRDSHHQRIQYQKKSRSSSLVFR